MGEWWGLPTQTAEVSSRQEATTYISRQRFAVISPGHTAPDLDTTYIDVLTVDYEQV